MSFALIIKDCHVLFVAATQKWEDSVDIWEFQDLWQIELYKVIILFSVELKNMVENQFN